MQKLYKSRDFYLSAYLIINSCKLLQCTNQNGISLFEFHEDEKLDELVSAFYSMKGICDAITYAGAIRNLKSIIHAAKSDSNSISISKQENLNHGSNNKYGEKL
jgi:hypothetical protein